LAVLLTACQVTTQPEFTEKKLTQTLVKIGVNNQIVKQTNQVIIVQSKRWRDKKGKCYLFERKKDQFKFVKSFPIVLGRNGMKWGKGLHHVDSANIKQEGDGATPAGVFWLGEAFGNEVITLLEKWPFRKTSQYDYFIDDSNSAYYNAWVDSRVVTKDWSSFEYMLREDGLYNRGVIIQHNMDPVKPLFGSAIFFHIWKHKNAGTAGCTASSKHNIETLLHWLKKDRQPLVIQLPKSYLEKLL
tara:strand:+ start:14354 stop:15082 length:729 start_codon:yes stop_codon:yes gene_type:complete